MKKQERERERGLGFLAKGWIFGLWIILAVWATLAVNFITLPEVGDNDVITTKGWNDIVKTLNQVSGRIKNVPIDAFDLVNLEYVQTLTGDAAGWWNTTVIVMWDTGLSVWWNVNYCRKLATNWTTTPINEGKLCDYSYDTWTGVTWISWCYNWECLEVDNWGDRFCQELNYTDWALSDANDFSICAVDAQCRFWICNSIPTWTLYAWEINWDRYLTTPWNCTDSSTPTCDWWVDTLIKIWGTYWTSTDVKSDTDWAWNTTTLATNYSDTEAAKYCYNMKYAWFDDWFLPAKDELNLLYTNKGTLWGFKSYYYWSSTEINSNNAWDQDFSNGSQINSNKNSSYYVRCVRKL